MMKAVDNIRKWKIYRVIKEDENYSIEYKFEQQSDFILGSFVTYSFFRNHIAIESSFKTIILCALLFAECSSAHWIDFPIQLLNENVWVSN